MSHCRIAAMLVLAILSLKLPSNAQLLPDGATSSGSPESRSQDQTKTASSHLETEPFLAHLTPHPYVYIGPSFMGGGYAPVAVRAEVGLNMESAHLVSKVHAGYDNGHQVNDADQPNPKGHDRYLGAALYFLPGRLILPSHAFFGAGWRWSQLSTSNYTKTANRPQIGGGYDFTRCSAPACTGDFSMRVIVDWVLAGNDWQNGSHGPDIAIIFPSPIEKRHWFWQENVAVYRFHATVTDRGNPSLTHSERADRSLTCYLDFGIVYRF